MQRTNFKGKVLQNARRNVLRLPYDKLREKTRDRIIGDIELIERKILIGAIVNTDFCKWMKENFSTHLFKTDTAQLITGWCLEYYERYDRAPNKDIEGIYTEKLQAGLDKAKGEWIEDILESLSEESEKDEINFEYLKDQTEHYKDRQLLQHRLEEGEQMLSNNDIDGVAELLGYEPERSRKKTLLSQLKASLYTSTDFIQRDIPRQKRFLRPWLAEGTLTLLYGPRGVGKTWLSCLIAMVLTRTDQDDLHIGSWQAKQKVGVLYVDAEMNNREMQDHLKNLSLPLPPEAPESPLFILSQHDYAQQYEKQMNLGQKECREALSSILQNDKRIKVLILDNAAALTPGIVENVKEDWDPVNQWLISLRHLGIAVLLIHHAGKGGQQRGTSGREDAMDTIIKLDYPKNYNANRDYAWFKITFDKSRNLQPGDDKRSFTLRIVEHPNRGLTWQEEAEKNQAQDKRQKIMAELINGKKNKEISKMFGVSAPYVSACKNEAQQKGFLDPDGKPTMEGFKLVEQYAEDGTEPIGA